ncbi:hypothetical protein [Planococcus sp. CAU13]|uniref:hypothetical protein n=1 Tax=Planococcus sp. CAU13 TaxID=1541197 RepID=UPI00052FF404|nr:hypothetical protein [Planococcus sp. CAU13]
MKKILLGASSLLLLLLLPLLIWWLQEEKPLKVAIIDKTVPTESYREHKGLPWILNHDRYGKEDGSRYQAATDYYGFMPNEEEEDYLIRDINELENNYDLIYLADTYGVYQEDLPWQAGNEEEGDERSELVYGGLKMEEWQTVKQRVLDDGSDLVVEFNTFASPTEGAVSADMEEFLGLKWSGWTGRYFPDLAADAEVPVWIITNFEQNGEEWQFTGGGFVLVDDESGKIVVLSEESGELAGDHGLHVKFTEAGEKAFGLDKSPSFDYWFDINEATAADVMAEYEWDLSAKGEQLLSEQKIPVNFPAILHREVNDSAVYYFAGDFVDVENVPAFYQYSGLAKLKALFSLDFFNSTDNFYWKTYVPVMQTVMAGSYGKDNAPEDTVSTAASKEGISYPAKISGQEFEVFEDGDWKKMTIKGVNLGMAKPGTFPGEAAITREEYDRWFEAIGKMNANAIRVYTLHPPAFYEAFAQYNKTAETPLYLFHGVWIDEGPLEETLDAFTPEITESFQQEMKTIVDVVHGNGRVEQKPGHAYGNYKADISDYVIGWMIGIEWHPHTVHEMGLKYQELDDFDGKFIKTEGANPMEHWLGQQLDILAAYEYETYQSMRPLSFTNWVTTDNIDQPAEPSEQEDMATVDPNHIMVKGELEEVGMFASYHVYPYYPDFLNLEEKYTEFVDHRGEKNNYAGYLRDLNDSHELPLLIAEFGIPASRGMTHTNPFGWNQGFISEREQGEIVSRLYEDILEEGMLGGLVFTWQDEWFKRTWNTMDYDNPDQRPFWSNAQTNEQQFGLLSFDRHKIKVDGEDDWHGDGILYEKGEGDLRSLSMDSDERYVYIKAGFDPQSAWWEKDSLRLYFSMRENKGIAVEEGFNADFELSLNGEEAALQVAGDYDTFYYDYFDRLEMIPEETEIESNFHPIRLALNKAVTRPDTGEQLPFESYETGKLRFGMANPDHEDYDSLNDYYYSGETGILEIRLPWMLLNAKDPSNKEFTGDIRKDGIEASMTVEGIKAAAVLEREDGKRESLGLDGSEVYSWEGWKLPESRERLKQSYYILQELFGNTN